MTTKQRSDMLNRYLTWAIGDLQNGKKISDDDWLTIRNEYPRVEDDRRREGMPESEIRRDLQYVINLFSRFSNEAGCQLRRLLFSGRSRLHWAEEDDGHVD